HFMTRKIDAGDIISQVEFSIDDNETALTLNQKCFDAGITSFKALVSDIVNNSLNRKVQAPAEGKYFSKYKRPDNAGIISWSNTAQHISVLVRAHYFGNHPNPFGAAKFKIHNEFYIVSNAEEIVSDQTYTPGRIITFDNQSITVGTENNAVKLSDLR